MDSTDLEFDPFFQANSTNKFLKNLKSISFKASTSKACHYSDFKIVLLYLYSRKVQTSDFHHWETISQQMTAMTDCKPREKELPLLL